MQTHDCDDAKIIAFVLAVICLGLIWVVRYQDKHPTVIRVKEQEYLLPAPPSQT